MDVLWDDCENVPRFIFPAFHLKCRLGAHYGGGAVTSRKYDGSK